jgi:hypothetical protein
VQRLLDTYYGAYYRTMDFDAFKAVFPGASSYDSQRLKQLHGTYSSCSYQLGEVAITPMTDARALAEVQVTETCTPKVKGQRQTVTRGQKFVLKGSGPNWAIQTGPG